MIIDDLNNIEKYSDVIPSLGKVFEFMKTVDIFNLEPGRHEVCENIFLNVDEYETKENSIPEVHRRYADIQIVLSGTEQIGYGGICDNFEGYDDARDILFLKADCDFVKADKTRFFIFYPGEIHQPCMTCNEKSKIKKAVFKILCE